jgi:hypothetical protein
MKIQRNKEELIDEETRNKVSTIILKILLEEYPMAFDIGFGSFSCKDYDCIICMVDERITTIRGFEQDEAYKFAGGVYKGNKKKYKKLNTTPFKNVREYVDKTTYVKNKKIRMKERED